ncbi:MAG TPA: long-chain fatty acid--CoA ligase [Lacipirellulaceae bacterium]|nr:long-chain fatty acid--CoA ligase [Lacipirellulaceae bacterium]
MEQLWTRSYDTGVATALRYPSHPLHEYLARAVRQYPDNPALIFFGRRLCYRELDEAASRFAAALQGLGLGKGDRVALLLPNTPQYLICYYGTLRAGGVVVPTNPQYTARELEHQMVDSGARILVTLSLFLPRVQEVRDRTPLEHVVVTNIKEYFPPVTKLLFGFLKEKKAGHRVAKPEPANILWLQELLSKHSAAELRPVEVSPEDLAVLGYTGGTTGVPKGAMLTHGNLVANVEQMSAWLPERREGAEIMMGALPFFHSYGQTVVMNQAVALGGTIVCIPNPRELDRVLQAIHKYKPTLFPGVPTLYTAINHHPRLQKYSLQSIRVCNSGAGALPPEVQKSFEALTGAKLVEGYGLTEASPVTHSNPLQGKRKIGSIGVPFPDTEVKLISPVTGAEVGPGEEGEIVIRGPQVMKGYWNRPDETAATLRDLGDGGGPWLFTGDIAKMDEEGYFYIVDRKKDMIKTSGFNVYPREIEDVLYEHPAILEAAVIGVPDQHRMEVAKAFVVLRPGHTATEQEIRDFCRERLTGYKVPRSIEFRDSLPKTMVGKILRRVLVEEERAKAAEAVPETAVA